MSLQSIVALGVPCITVNHMLIVIKRDFICRLLRFWKLPYYVKLKIGRNHCGVALTRFANQICTTVRIGCEPVCDPRTSLVLERYHSGVALTGYCEPDLQPRWSYSGSSQCFRPWTAIIIFMVLFLVAPSVFVLRRP
jgi:hypothetical protein